MDIIAGNTRITVNAVRGDTRYWKDAPRPALRVSFSGGVTAQNLQDLLKNDWRLVEQVDGVDQELSVQKGYTAMEAHEAIFIRMDTVEAENIELKAAIPQLLTGRNDDSLVQFIALLPQWQPGAFEVGDVRRGEDGQPYRCVQAHDSTGNPSWDTSTASLWMVYHAKSAEHALPYKAPSGAHDIYKAGEYMLYTDGKVHHALQDTAYSPDEYPQAWEKCRIRRKYGPEHNA